MNIGWPEGIWIGCMLLNLVIVASMDGEPKTGNHKFAVTFTGCMLSFLLLWWGGFFA